MEFVVGFAWKFNKIVRISAPDLLYFNKIVYKSTHTRSVSNFSKLYHVFVSNFTCYNRFSQKILFNFIKIYLKSNATPTRESLKILIKFRTISPENYPQFIRYLSKILHTIPCFHPKTPYNFPKLHMYFCFSVISYEHTSMLSC